jgi:pSer/pThr/pTyr-binding forkhead associated (FHA) protein
VTAVAYRLEIQEPGQAPRVVVIGREVEIGRACDGIVLDDPLASRRHAKLDPIDEGVVLTDLGSANGTLAGGEPLDEPMVLLPGAWFQVGETRIVIHEGRDGDHHSVGSEGAPAPGRASSGRKSLGQAAAHTRRPGGSVPRPPRS